MRIHILSDLHLGFADFQPPATHADVVVLAGDVDVGFRGLRWAQQAFGDTPVIYVLGNHEYYGEALPKLTLKLAAEGENWPVRVLERSALELNGVRFMGCTLWTDLRLHGNLRLAAAAVGDAMADYHMIRVSPEYRRLRPSDTASLHHAAVEWLQAEWGRSALPTVVVSHHAPSARSLDPVFGDDPVNAGFASALEPLIETLKPLVWIHGHVHRAADYKIASIRVICNPRGYPEESSNGFDPGLAIEI